MAAMSARWWAFGVWALVAASAAYWGLRLFVGSPPVPPQATVAPAAASPRGDLARLLGADAVPVVAPVAPVASRFHLVGVVAPRHDPGSRDGVALIAVDGKPARAYRVGSAVDGDTVLQSVRQRGATLGPRGGAEGVALEIPPPAAAATGTLPAAAGLAPAPPSIPVPPPNLAPQGMPGAPGVLPPRPPTVMPLPGRGGAGPRPLPGMPAEAPARADLQPAQ